MNLFWNKIPSHSIHCQLVYVYVCVDILYLSLFHSDFFNCCPWHKIKNDFVAGILFHSKGELSLKLNMYVLKLLNRLGPVENNKCIMFVFVCMCIINSPYYFANAYVVNLWAKNCRKEIPNETDKCNIVCFLASSSSSFL